MTLTGPDILAALDDALRAICREEDEILAKVSRSGERLGKFREAEGELLRQFAAGRIAEPAATALPPARTGDTAPARTAATVERLAALEEALAARQAERAAALAELDRQQAALRALAPRIAAAVARDPDYALARQAAQALKSIAAEAQTKARLADLDREQKGRPYRSDPVFNYLLERGFGTPAYSPTGLIARLDGWVAKLIGFEQARRNFALLNEIPARLRAHAELQQQRYSAAEELVDQLENRAIDAAGGAPLRAGLEAAQARIDAADAAIVAIAYERDDLTRAATRLAETGDPAFAAAVRRMTQALGAADIPALIVLELQRNGRGTPLLVQLDEAHRRVSEEEADAREDLARLNILATRRRQFEGILGEFKAARFDDPRSLFADDELTTGRLNGFLTGKIAADGYRAALRQGQGWSVGTSDWAGGVGLPRRGRTVGAAPATAEQPAVAGPRAAAADA